MKSRSIKLGQFALLCIFGLTCLTAMSKDKVVGGIVGCETDMYQDLNGTIIRDTILRLRNFNNATPITITRIVSHVASGKVVYDSAANNKFPSGFTGSLAANSGVLLRFSDLTNIRVHTGLNVAQVLFYWVPTNDEATVGLSVAAVKRIRTSSFIGNHTNHCHVISTTAPVIPVIDPPK